MNKYIKRAFIRAYRLYVRWGDFDAFFTTAFVLSLQFAFITNFVIALLYYFTGIDALFFRPMTIGLIFLAIIILGVKYFYNNKQNLLKEVESFNLPVGKIDWLIIVSVIAIWILGALSAFLYRWRYLGY